MIFCNFFFCIILENGYEIHFLICTIKFSPKRGPSRPFNFFGYLTSKTMDRLSDILQPESPYNHTFVVSLLFIIINVKWA